MTESFSSRKEAFVDEFLYRSAKPISNCVDSTRCAFFLPFIMRWGRPTVRVEIAEAKSFGRQKWIKSWSRAIFLFSYNLIITRADPVGLHAHRNSRDSFCRWSEVEELDIEPWSAISDLQARIIKKETERGKEKKKDKQLVGKTRIINGSIIKLTFFSIIFNDPSWCRLYKCFTFPPLFYPSLQLTVWVHLVCSIRDRKIGKGQDFH